MLPGLLRAQIGRRADEIQLLWEFRNYLDFLPNRKFRTYRIPLAAYSCSITGDGAIYTPARITQEMDIGHRP